MKKPISLSSVASELASNDFPTLPRSTAAKLVRNPFPQQSVWAKKSHLITCSNNELISCLICNIVGILKEKFISIKFLAPNL